jgi:dTDP-4-amino-4,6-dideoxygalactose transaminase
MKIPLVDLKLQYENIKDEIESAIKEILKETNFILGLQVETLEKEIARYSGVKFAIGVASGTDALVLALTALNIGKGDEVVTTPFTFIATAEAICRVGARPVFCDIDYHTYNLAPEKVEKKITQKTKAILPVHLYGLPCEMDRILSLAKKYGLKVIEDCAQALGSEYKSKKVGSLGDVGCISFFPGKNLGCYGDGGMVITNDEKVAQNVKMLRNHGSTTKYYYGMHGFNSRLDTLQAAILQVKLKYINRWIDLRIKNANLYNELLKNTDIICPTNNLDYMKHSFNYYTIRIKKDRDSVQKYLKQNGIASAVYYPLCLHLQEVYKDLDYQKGDFPIAEQAQEEVLSLPMYPELTKEQIQEVVKIIKQVI